MHSILLCAESADQQGGCSSRPYTLKCLHVSSLYQFQFNMALHTKAVKNHAYWLGNEIERVFPDLENPHENCDLRLNYWTLERGKIISNFITDNN